MNPECEYCEESSIVDIERCSCCLDLEQQIATYSRFAAADYDRAKGMRDYATKMPERERGVQLALARLAEATGDLAMARANRAGADLDDRMAPKTARLGRGAA